MNVCEHLLFFFTGTIADPSKLEQSSLGTQPKHLLARQVANAMYHRNVQRMKDKFDKNASTEKFELGDYVSVKIPRKDRVSSDMPRLPARFVSVNNGNK